MLIHQTNNIMLYILLTIILGSIPFGFIIIKIAGKGDIREYGSGNIGATNVMRTGGKALGAVTLLLDVAKGLLPVLLAKHVGHIQSEELTFIVLTAVMAHIFTPWLKFHGGKGVATAMGAILAYHPTMLLPPITSFIITLLIFRYVSLSSIIAAITLLLTTIGLFGSWATIPIRINFPIWLCILNWSILVSIVILKHVSNIRRIINRTESKL